jgi:hypothetical protein
LLLLPVPASADRQGIVRGGLVNGTDPSIVPAKAEFDVIAVGDGGMSILRSGVTGSEGRFSLQGLSLDQTLMIRVNYKSAPYHGELRFDKNGHAAVTLSVFEPTTSMKDIHVRRPQIGFRQAGDRLQLIEKISFQNQTHPPRTFVGSSGSFRFSRAAGILEPPRLAIAAPGATMPIVQAPLESPDRQSYYSLYPLRPGVTTFEVQQLLPYASRSYTYRRKFYHDTGLFKVGVMPLDLTLSGAGLAKTESDERQNFAVFSGSGVRAGTEVVWTVSGGAPPPKTEASKIAATSPGRVLPQPNAVSRNAFAIGPLLLMAFVIALWHASSRMPQDVRGELRELKTRRTQLIGLIADLDDRYERHTVDRQEYTRARNYGKSQLRKIALLSRRIR